MRMYHECFELAFGHCACCGSLRDGMVDYFDDWIVWRSS